jgi:putative membrane protein
MEFLKFSLAGFDDFLVYFGLCVAFVIAFLRIYITVTPYSEIKLIREGNHAAAWSLGFTLIGFSLPLASAAVHSVNPWDLMLWAGIALVVQVLIYVVVRALLPELPKHIAEGQVSSGAFLGCVSLAGGILNAACMTY